MTSGPRGNDDECFSDQRRRQGSIPPRDNLALRAGFQEVAHAQANDRGSRCGDGTGPRDRCGPRISPVPRRARLQPVPRRHRVDVRQRNHGGKERRHLRPQGPRQPAADVEVPPSLRHQRRFDRVRRRLHRGDKGRGLARPARRVLDPARVADRRHDRRRVPLHLRRRRGTLRDRSGGSRAVGHRHRRHGSLPPARVGDEGRRPVGRR